MINESQRTLIELNKVAQQLHNEFFLIKQIECATDYVNDLPNIEENILILSKELESSNTSDKDKICKLLKQLYIEYSNYILRIEQVHRLIKIMIADYREYKK